jgi:hypothetical protein
LSYILLKDIGGGEEDVEVKMGRKGGVWMGSPSGS